MKNMSKTIKGILLGSLLLSSVPQSTEAFGLIPPLPFEIAPDFTAAAEKAVTAGEAELLQIATGFATGNSLSLKSIGGKLLNVTLGKFAGEKSGAKKSPTKGLASENSELLISPDTMTDEAVFMNAYDRLFFIYPDLEEFKGIAKSAESDDPLNLAQVVQTAYKHKRNEFRQDIIIDTYMAGLQTERYLKLVEKTLTRLQKCVNNQLAEKDCSFFGLQMKRVPSSKEAPSSGENPGQITIAMNQYIVMTVYDRMLRIVEDLVSAEAIFQASKQNDLATPEVPDKDSSAEDYIATTYKFAHHETHTSSYAKYKGDCFNGKGDDKRCPTINETLVLEPLSDDAEILKKLNPIEDTLNKATLLHNLKNKMPEYKTQYRKYRQSVKIHDNIMRALKDADTCAAEMITNHSKSGDVAWGSVTPVNNHEGRPAGSISRELIQNYQKAINEIIIGSSAECEGYYEECPDGYILGDACEADQSLHQCTAEVVTMDVERDNPSENDNIDNLYNKITGMPDPQSSTYNSADYLKKSSDIDKIEEQNYLRNRQSWQIGADKMMELTLDSKLEFTPWNDQKIMQKEYMYNKYNNIRNIIKSVDTAKNSYKVAQALATKDEYSKQDNSIKSIISPLINLAEDLSSCLDWDSALAQAKELYSSYEVDGDKDNGEIKLYKDIDGKKVLQDTLKQRINGNSVECAFNLARERTVPDLTQETSGTDCTWSLAAPVSSLVRNYLPKYYSNNKCNDSLETQANEMVNKANGKGRKIAQNYVEGVMKARADGDEKLRKIITKYDNDKRNKENELEIAKKSLEVSNASIDEATNKKNIATKEWARSQKRVTAIDKALKTLEKNLKKADEKAKCAWAMSIQALDYEREAIESNTSEIELRKKYNACPKECDIESITNKEELCNKRSFLNNRVTMTMYEAYSNSENTDEKRHVPLDTARDAKDQQEKNIKYYTAARNSANEKITTLENELTGLAEKFTEDYLNTAEKVEEEIKEANIEFESFLTKTDRKGRMKNGKKWVDNNGQGYEDNLATTAVEFFGKGNLETQIKNNLRNELNAMDYASLGLPKNFVILNSGLTGTLGIANGYNTAEAVIKALKEAIIEKATAEIINNIENADKAIEAEIESAVAEVEYAAKYNIGIDLTAREFHKYPYQRFDGKKVNFDGEKVIMNRLSYNGEGENDIITAHKNLIAKLRQPESDNKDLLAKAGIDLSDVFGIPTEENLEPAEGADKYIVTLPARGTNYTYRKDYEGKNKRDENAGADFRAPNAPMINLPPLREIFYYSNDDYETIPSTKVKEKVNVGGKKKKKEFTKPAITELLKERYKDVEYLPEIWRYLLARPNNRGVYMETYVERPFDNKILFDYLGRNTNSSNAQYFTLIGRGGVYPCKLSNSSMIIDINQNEAPEDMSFVSVKNAPAPITCKEVRLNSDSSYNSDCYTYNYKGKSSKKRKGGICHLLADHGNSKVEDSQKSVGSIPYPGNYSELSELGQFLEPLNESADKPLSFAYRRLVKNSYNYIKEKSSKGNDINLRKANQVSFTRNIFGSFLDLVAAEKSSRSNMEKTEEETKATIDNLCQEIHNQQKSVNGEYKEGECDAACVEERTVACRQYIINMGGLASTPEDTRYGEDGEYSDKKFAGVDCQKPSGYYDQIFCNILDAKKDELVNAAKSKLAIIKKDISKVDKARVQERLDKIDELIKVLEADKNEVTKIYSDVTLSEVESKIKEEKVNRTAARTTEDEGITAMGNQSQIVPYCPTYTK